MHIIEKSTDILMRCDRCLNESVRYVHVIMYNGKPVCALGDSKSAELHKQHLAWNKGYNEELLSIEECKLLGA